MWRDSRNSNRIIRSTHVIQSGSCNSNRTMRLTCVHTEWLLQQQQNHSLNIFAYTSIVTLATAAEAFALYSGIYDWSDSPISKRTITLPRCATLPFISSEKCMVCSSSTRHLGEVINVTTEYTVCRFWATFLQHSSNAQKIPSVAPSLRHANMRFVKGNYY
jgi:hypothetical protein